ncbi:hypothetical protein BDR04DRAFT_579981 [Suillus decipiens]|nr:hypothetical protein BDR04DRAFT_579981 [Suillus decipiens]
MALSSRQVTSHRTGRMMRRPSLFSPVRQLTYTLVKVPNLPDAEFKHVKAIAIDTVTHQILVAFTTNTFQVSRSCRNKEERDQCDRNSIQSNPISQHPSRTPPRETLPPNLSLPNPKASTQIPKRKGLPRHQMPSEYRPTLRSSKRLHRNKKYDPITDTAHGAFR